MYVVTFDNLQMLFLAAKSAVIEARKKAKDVEVHYFYDFTVESNTGPITQVYTGITLWAKVDDERELNIRFQTSWAPGKAPNPVDEPFRTFLKGSHQESNRIVQNITDIDFLFTDGLMRQEPSEYAWRSLGHA